MRSICILLACAGVLMADFRYDSTTRVTKGMVTRMAFGKKPEPTTTTHYVKGGRMATVSKDMRMIVDFDKQTMTTVQLEKKQYWQVTFEEMRQMMADAQADIRDVQANMSFDAKATGVEKEVNGFPARQMIFTVQMQSSDSRNTAGGTKMVSDSWHSEAVPGYKEYRTFFDRLKDKGNWMTMGNPMAQMGGQPGMAEAMRKMAEEMQKTPGIAVLTISRVHMPGMNMAMTRTTPDGRTEQVDAGTAAKEAAGETAGRQVAGGLGGALGGALGGRLGGFGRKKQEAPKQEAPAARPQEPAAESSADGMLLMESFTEASNFSTEPISEEVFAIPAGFTKVDPEFGKRRRR